MTDRASLFVVNQYVNGYPSAPDVDEDLAVFHDKVEAEKFRDALAAKAPRHTRLSVVDLSALPVNPSADQFASVMLLDVDSSVDEMDVKDIELETGYNELVVHFLPASHSVRKALEVSDTVLIIHRDAGAEPTVVPAEDAVRALMERLDEFGTHLPMFTVATNHSPFAERELNEWVNQLQEALNDARS